MKHESFWVVWALDGGSPTIRHPSYVVAKVEAVRLAREHPGMTFVVCAPVAGFLKREVDEWAYDLGARHDEVLDAEIPF